ncbi:CHAP domain-containing protein [Moraxella caviae]|uniref:CHAP domain n=1 Tax=Moraxella caviae TaxID=34060 RepID=A0A1T0A115_9GAMM|nr:CHAP domain-containing protein [Moraxella caviae]OOR89442.1 CHAP domain-containing protein [Moraxella caviae]STZ09835.1 CHAP domain [Moraxella caviae]
MKRILWLVSAVGLSVAQTSSAHTISNNLDDAINSLIAQSNQASANRNFATTANQAVIQTPHISASNTNQRISSAFSQSSTFSAPSSFTASQLTANSAPSIAASAASRAAHGRSVGRCALYVRRALQSAGYEFTPLPSAYQYANGTLAGAGFTQISSTNYEPQVGDVVVFNRTSRNPHGHIQIYDGKDWVSDFRQPKFSPYSKHNGYTVWRDTRYLDASATSGTMLAMNEQ